MTEIIEKGIIEEVLPLAGRADFLPDSKGWTLWDLKEEWDLLVTF